MYRSAIATTAFVLAALAAPSGALAASKDSNHDGLPDGWEVKHHLSLKVNEANLDQDHDGLNNLGELRHGTDPRKADSDRDGLKDGAEVKTGNNPRQRDTDGDGVRDGRENAGTIASFANGILTVKLANGQTISGTVSDATHTSCHAENENEIENETTVHNQRRRGVSARASAAKNGVPASSGVASDVPQADSPSQHNGGETEVENEHGTETGTHNGGATGVQHSSTCESTGMVAGTSVHEAEIHHTASGSTFSKVELMH
jgi:thrombospondin type 3 repeat protein